MVANPNVMDVSPREKKRKHPEKRKNQPTEHQKNTKYQNV